MGDVREATAALAARLREIGVVPVVELPRTEDAVPLAGALLAGGLSCVEITFRTPAAVEGDRRDPRRAIPTSSSARAPCCRSSRWTSRSRPGPTSPSRPGTNHAGRARPRRARAADPPGRRDAERDRAGAAHSGSRLLKLFPAELLGGAAYLRALCGPYRDVAFVPTGSDHADDAARLPRGARRSLACGGSWMVKPRADRARASSTRSRELAAEARRARGGGRDERASRCARRAECRYDLVALGEVMLRLDPGRRAHRDHPHVHGLGGRRRVQRRARPAPLLRPADRASSPRSPTTRSAGCVEDLMLQGGVDPSHVRWVPYDGVGRDGPQRAQLHRARLRRPRRGRVLRPRPHRGLAAAARATSTGTRSSDGEGARWFHTGGIFCALSETTAAGRARGDRRGARATARSSRTTSTTGESLWKAIGGHERGRAR